MPRRLILNAFTNNSVSHLYHGLWPDPDTRQAEYADLATWVEVARVLERGAFDGIFWADNVGVGPAFRGSQEIYAKHGIFFPVNDPAVLAAALIGATEHLGLFVTSSIVQEHPFQFARKLSTLDHLSKGRVAWNVVTSSLESTHRNFGLESIVAHDERYQWAEEYLEVVYKLWEGSWEEGAAVHDRDRRVYSDISRIHPIDHVGTRYRVPGPHLAEPSPQRTPVLAQAGTSDAGRTFAARHAEIQLVSAASPEDAAHITADVRKRATAAGRDPGSIRFLQALSFSIGSTEEEAKRRAAELDDRVDLDAILAHFSRGLPFDAGAVAPDTPLAELDLTTEGSRTIIDTIQRGAGPEARPTVADFARYFLAQNRIVGTPEQIADELERWQAAGIDGINVLAARRPGSWEEFVDHVVPVLRARGLAQHEYAPGTLREKLFEDGPRLRPDHPGASYRRP